MVVPEGGEKVFSRNMPAGLFKLLVVLSAIWVVFLVGITIVYARLSVQASKAVMLQGENQRLREYFGRVVEIEKSFKRNQELTARLAEMAGVDLATINDQPRIDFDSLRTDRTGDASTRRVSSTEDSALTPEQLTEQHVPYGRPLYGWITRAYTSGGEGGLHTGMDFAIKEGTDVAATASGTILSSGWDEELGNFVVIDHGNGFLTTYGHNKELLVKKDEKVTRGEIIALSGNTGNSSAPHLHYEIVKDGVPVDPAPYLD